AIENLHYWNGNRTLFSGTQLLDSPTANAHLCTSMIQAIYDDTSGLALALPPLEIVPAFQQTLIQTEGKFQLQLEIPLVLDVGESDVFPLEIYQFTPRYGFL